MPVHLTLIDLIIILRCYPVQNAFLRTIRLAYVVNFGLRGVLIPTTCDYFLNNNKQLFWAKTQFSVRYKFCLDGFSPSKEQRVYNKTDVESVVSLLVLG
jgi:hypothetical protein